jgi:hypothetical protein
MMVEVFCAPVALSTMLREFFYMRTTKIAKKGKVFFLKPYSIDLSKQNITLVNDIYIPGKLWDQLDQFS